MRSLSTQLLRIISHQPTEALTHPLPSTNHLAGSQTYLQTCYCMCWESHSESWELYISLLQHTAHCISLLLGGNVDSTCAGLQHVKPVLTSAVLQAVNPAIVQKPNRNTENSSDLWVLGGEKEKEEEEGEDGDDDYLWRSLLLFFLFSLSLFLSAHPSSCELNSAVSLTPYKFSVWSHFQQNECVGHLSCLKK